jgi:hypothetical protein
VRNRSPDVTDWSISTDPLPIKNDPAGAEAALEAWVVRGRKGGGWRRPYVFYFNARFSIRASASDGHRPTSLI